ncbi:NADH-ubiquinone oxidoreductase [Acetobacter pomorum]|uniref:NADH-ubiquinone oxidoreductase n=1 Tax=Acetobacter pomorum TaxID=65959 RepID=A0A2G4REV5_9PROT|nr:SDR family oxidoreductase [Acetobacter pomorum]PHY95109.1 NADH-ubiquinone oxidoreductase [Acetobacter pomorum]GBR48762.1 NADH-ubiquinone oxidoreductase 39-40 kDa subunit [Acetobacter pomorum DSM 11825]
MQRPDTVFPQASPVHVIGASGRSGRAVCQALLAKGVPVIPVVRNASKAIGLKNIRIADLTAPTARLKPILEDATRIVCTAHARNIPALLAAAPPAAKLVCLGSTRKFTHWPDAHGNGVLLGEKALMASGRDGIILHPTMIYGAQGENNVQRLAALLRFLPVIPLPNGGTALVQPIWQGDVTASVLAALERTWQGPRSLVIAGKNAVTYKQFVSLVEQASGLRPRPFISLPAKFLMACARITSRIPGLPEIGPDEIRRLLENKNFDISPMQNFLGVQPIDLQEGLARTFTG